MTQQTARQLERAARVALDLLNNLTSEDFARGGDKAAGLALSAAIAAVDGEKAIRDADAIHARAQSDQLRSWGVPKRSRRRFAGGKVQHLHGKS